MLTVSLISFKWLATKLYWYNGLFQDVSRPHKVFFKITYYLTELFGLERGSILDSVRNSISRVWVGRGSNGSKIAFQCVFALRDGPIDGLTDRQSDL